MFNSTMYRGRRTEEGAHVWRERDSLKSPLPLRLDLWSHSPAGFEWGYHGSGPAQLALAILADALGDDVTAVGFHQRFKRMVVAKFDHEGWCFSAEHALTWIRSVGNPAADPPEVANVDNEGIDLSKEGSDNDPPT